MRWFIDTVRDWDLRVHAIAAHGFYKLMIRKTPNGEVWCWATEWKHSHRVIGFAGDEMVVRKIAAAMPDQLMDLIHQSGDDWIRMRNDTPLSYEDDNLSLRAMKTCRWGNRRLEVTYQHEPLAGGMMVVRPSFFLPLLRLPVDLINAFHCPCQKRSIRL